MTPFRPRFFILLLAFGWSAWAQPPFPPAFCNPRASAQSATQPQQAVVVQSDVLDHTARFQLTAGAHKFCLDGGREYFTGVTVEDSVHIAIPVTVDAQGCARVVVPQEGIYTVRVLHTENAPPTTTATMVTADLPSPPLCTPQGVPRKGYWAIYPDQANFDPSPIPGRIRAVPPFRNMAGFPQAVPLVADFSTSQMDEYSLFQFNARSPAILAGPAGTYLDFEYIGPIPDPFGGPPYGTVVVSNQPCQYGPHTCNNFSADPMYLEDLHDSSKFQLIRQSTSDPRAPIHFGFINKPLSNAMTVLSTCFFCNAPFQFHLAFRFFPDGTQMGPLYQGEVALYQQPNYQGKTAVFAVNTPSLTVFNSNAITIDKSAVSIKLGPNTVATLYPSANYGGTPTTVISNTQQLSGAPNATSIQIGSLTAYMIANKHCENCNLQGIDLSGLDVSGFTLPGANFAGANLTNTHFNGAILTGADFTGATLNCTDFSGADKDHLNDLTQTTFTNAQIAPPSPCRVNFSYTKLTSRTIPPALWKTVDLTGAVFTDLQGKPLSSQAQPLDLTGAMLGGASLQYATLDYATGLPSATLKGITLDNASLKGCDLRKAVLDNAHMAHVDLTGAQLAGVSLDHTVLDYAVAIGKADFSQFSNLNYTSLQYIDLTGTPLKGLNLQTVILDHATGLVGADLTNTIFSNGSLRHVDLHTALLYGAQLDNANLDGANLAGAFLTKACTDCSGANLAGAFLRNVNLSQGKISAAVFTGANFYSSTATATCTPDPTTGFTKGCATAAHATMDNTAFGGAYLYGVDFSSATAQGVNFGGAYLAGANFDKAQLSVDASGLNTGFTGAFLQGTNLGTAQIQNSPSFDNAFVDFRQQGNEIYLDLKGHTSFAGYWGTKGEDVCARMSYSTPTTVPPTDKHTACPNGSHNDTGCGQAAPDGSNPSWKAINDITQLASYKWDSTYTPAPADGQPKCKYDFRWIE